MTNPYSFNNDDETKSVEEWTPEDVLEGPRSDDAAPWRSAMFLSRAQEMARRRPPIDEVEVENPRFNEDTLNDMDRFALYTRVQDRKLNSVRGTYDALADSCAGGMGLFGKLVFAPLTLVAIPLGLVALPFYAIARVAARARCCYSGLTDDEEVEADLDLRQMRETVATADPSINDYDDLDPVCGRCDTVHPNSDECNVPQERAAKNRAARDLKDKETLNSLKKKLLKAEAKTRFNSYWFTNVVRQWKHRRSQAQRKAKFDREQLHREMLYNREAARRAKLRKDAYEAHRRGEFARELAHVFAARAALARYRRMSLAHYRKQMRYLNQMRVRYWARSILNREIYRAYEAAYNAAYDQAKAYFDERGGKVPNPEREEWTWRRKYVEQGWDPKLVGTEGDERKTPEQLMALFGSKYRPEGDPKPPAYVDVFFERNPSRPKVLNDFIKQHMDKEWEDLKYPKFPNTVKPFLYSNFPLTMAHFGVDPFVPMPFVDPVEAIPAFVRFVFKDEYVPLRWSAYRMMQSKLVMRNIETDRDSLFYHKFVSRKKPRRDRRKFIVRMALLAQSKFPLDVLAVPNVAHYSVVRKWIYQMMLDHGHAEVHVARDVEASAMLAFVPNHYIVASRRAGSSVAYRKRITEFVTVPGVACTWRELVLGRISLEEYRAGLGQNAFGKFTKAN